VISGCLHSVMKVFALFWQVTQRRLLVSYRRFGTTSRSNLLLILELLDPRILGRCVPKRR
jgi:hypothetical protein